MGWGGGGDMPESAQTPSNYMSKVQVFKSGGTFLILSMRCRTDPVFLVPVVSRQVTLCNIYIKPVPKRCKNAMPKSR